MARGQQDFGMYAPKSILAGMADLGEAVVRLGGISPFDRRGNVIWFDDFQGGVSAWENEGNGTGNALESSSAASKRGGFSAKVVCGTTINYKGGASHTRPLPASGNVGFEISFTNPNDIDYMVAYLVLYTGTSLVYSGLKWDASEDKLYYYGPTPWVELASSLSLFQDNIAFHTLKIVVDFTALEYVRAIFGETEYDLSDISLVTLPSALAPQVRLVFENYGDSGANRYGYIADAILTVNEP